jgi:hypothetical protein
VVYAELEALRFEDRPACIVVVLLARDVLG